MIPKIIHYCWFGGNPIPDEYNKYIETWKKFCPDYEIKEWNEKNFDVMQNQYCKEAYEAKKWAFVSDYARLKVIYEHGGIYLDTDVELVKSLDELLSAGEGFIGFQNQEQINTGLGFSANAHNSCIKKMLNIYDIIHFKNNDHTYNMTPSPVFNTIALKKCGLKTGKTSSEIIQHLDGINIYPEKYFNPLDRETGELSLSDDTMSIHHYSATWITDKSKKLRMLKSLIPNFILKKRTLYISKRDVINTERILNNKW